MRELFNDCCSEGTLGLSNRLMSPNVLFTSFNLALYIAYGLGLLVNEGTDEFWNWNTQPY